MHDRTAQGQPGRTTLQLVSTYGDALAKQQRDRDRDRQRNIDVSDAPDWAAELAARRKELSVLEKAAAAWRLHSENHWTQDKIGRLFGVTGSAVHNWLKNAEDPAYLARRRTTRAAWREENRYRIADYFREWRQRDNHGDEAKSWRDAAWQAQDGRCYLCERDLGPDRMAIIEHDHRCCPNGKSCVICRRGLACDPCNRLIGFAGDDPDRVELIGRNLRSARDAVTERLADQRY
jgi:Recombination endonuclease VII